MAALRRQTLDVRVGSGCLQKEVKSCDHHEMVATPYGIYPGREHDSIRKDAIADLVDVESKDLDERLL